MTSFKGTVTRVLSRLLVLRAWKMAVIREVALICSSPAEAVGGSCEFAITGVDAPSCELLVL